MMRDVAQRANTTYTTTTIPQQSLPTTSTLPLDDCRRSKSLTRMKRRYIVLGSIASVVFLYVCIKLNILEVLSPVKISSKNTTQSQIQIGSTGSIKEDGQSGAHNGRPSRDGESGVTQPISDEGKPTSLPTFRKIITDHPTMTPTKAPSIPKSSKPISISSTPIKFTKSRTDNSDFSATEISFLDKYCSFDPKDATDEDQGWYPSSDESRWKQKAPAIILAGTRQSATTSLYNALLKHPNVVDAARTKNIGYFMPNLFSQFLTGRKSATVKNADGNSDAPPVQRRRVFSARIKMYAAQYPKKTNLKKFSNATAANSKIAMDGTSSYFPNSDQVPYNILCTTPWSKIILLFRDPVKRLYSQWASDVSQYRLKVSFKEWVAVELQMMQTVGLIATSEHPAPSPGSTEEFEAWENYLKTTRQRGFKEPALGMSMYVIPLLQWITAYQGAGKNVTNEFHVLPMEALVSSNVDTRNAVYGNLLKFVGLPAPYEAPNPFPHANRPKVNALVDNDMGEEMKAMLEGFFAPYNKRLFRTLKKHKLNNAVQNWKTIWT